MDNQSKKASGVDRFIEWIGSRSSLVAHTVFFAACFALAPFGLPLDRILLVLTTVVSLEAIYMGIFIQMAVNRNTRSLHEVVEDVDEIQEDVEEIQKDVDEIQKDVDVIQEDVEEIQEDVEEIQEDVDVIQEDVSSEADDDLHLMHGQSTQATLTAIEKQLQRLISEIESIKSEKK